MFLVRQVGIKRDASLSHTINSHQLEISGRDQIRPRGVRLPSRTISVDREKGFSLSTLIERSIQVGIAQPGVATIRPDIRWIKCLGKMKQHTYAGGKYFVRSQEVG